MSDSEKQENGPDPNSQCQTAAAGSVCQFGLGQDVPAQDAGPSLEATPQQTFEIPDGGYGWVCVAACFMVNAFTWGVVSVRLVRAHVSDAIADNKQLSLTASTSPSTCPIRPSPILSHWTMLLSEDLTLA